MTGDFNDISSAEEKSGGAPFDEARSARFRAWMGSCSLIDLGAVENSFTWNGPKWRNRR